MAASFLQGGEFVLRSRSSVEELKIRNNLRFKNWILIRLTWHRSLRRESSRTQSKWKNMAGKESSWKEFTNSIRFLHRVAVWIFHSLIEECDIETKNELNIRLMNFKFSCSSYFIDLNNIVISFNTNKAPGHDNISMKIILQSFQNIAQPLVTIINTSLSTGVFPESLKIAKVIPVLWVFKAGDPTLFSNYRPISILPAFSKLFKKVMYNQLINV